MNEQPKNGRGRPRKYPTYLIDELKSNHGIISDRGAQNKLNCSFALVKICDNCSIETQKYFLGGITKEDIMNYTRPTKKAKNYIMQELGRYPEEYIARLAERIASDKSINSLPQQDVVNILKKLRLTKLKD